MTDAAIAISAPHIPWNKGKIIGAKPPFRPKHVWTIRTKLQVAGRIRDLALFNLAIDSKLRGWTASLRSSCSKTVATSSANVLGGRRSTGVNSIRFVPYRLGRFTPDSQPRCERDGRSRRAISGYSITSSAWAGRVVGIFTTSAFCSHWNDKELELRQPHRRQIGCRLTLQDARATTAAAKWFTSP
jgi:hypothetical protein